MNQLQRYSDEELMLLMNSDIQQEMKQRGYVFGWHKKTEYAGVIYVLVNPAFPSLVKIGYTNNIDARLKSLNRNSGLPDPFHVYATYKVKKRLEDLRLHALIDSLDASLRHTPNKEFYEMTPDKAYGILSAIAQINGDEDLLEKDPLHDAFFTTPSLPTAAVADTKTDNGNNTTTPVMKKKKRLTFEMLGIPVGSTLVYKDDPNVTVTTVDDASGVMYQGKIYKLSHVVALLKNGGSWQGGVYFLYNGKTLVAMREEIEKG